MKRAFKAFAVAAAGLALALLAPIQAWAACPGGVPISQCLAGGGGLLLQSQNVGGTYWVPGQGQDAVGGGGGGDLSGGDDAGQLAGFPLPLDGSSWLTDFGAGPGFACFVWDYGSFGSDGCADGIGEPLTALVRDDLGNYALMQVAASGAASYEFDIINNGTTGPLGGAGNGVDFRKAFHVTSATDQGSTVEVTVTPNLFQHDDLGGGRAIPGTLQYTNVVNSVRTVLGTANTNVVQADSQLCAELQNGALTVLVGCRDIGGSTPSQNVINGKADLSKGGAKFSWDVTAQFDVAGFNIYQKNVTKGTERKLNGDLIPLSGDNDATAEAYSFSAQRSDLRAVKGGFEIELVRQNGETSRAPVAVTR